MTPLSFAPMHLPGPISTGIFAVLISLVASSFVAGIYASARPEESEGARVRAASRAAALVSGWLSLTGGLALSGLLELGAPVVMMYVGGCALAAVALALSPIGARLTRLSAASLAGFQLFRLPLELILHSWYEQGTLPVQMTWSGQNFDVLTGIFALGVLAARREPPAAAIWAFQIAGLGLLFNVMRIAITSAPLPVRLFLEDPPVLLPFYFPYTWIVSVAVAGALCGHLVLLRKQLSGASP